MNEELDFDRGTCSDCGTKLPEQGTKGLCPSCLMAAAMLPTSPLVTSSGDDFEAATFSPTDIESIQTAFPQLEIIELVGVGGMGTVYKAKQRTLNREVALKLLSPQPSTASSFADRFEREAQALATMNHPNIITIHDFGEAGGFYYLLMELVDGVNLREIVKKGKFSTKEALAIVPPICDALQYAHDQGVVHRDIKPENILLDQSGVVKVADFGIAKLLNQADLDSNTEASGEGVNLTRGSALGTPSYMAPEQAESPTEVDHRADIYSLGVVFYEMLTGERPGESIQPPSTKIHLDVRLDEVVLRALEDTPEQRWQSADDLKTQVQTIVTSGVLEEAMRKTDSPLLDANPPKRKRWIYWVTMGCLLFALGLNYFPFKRPPNSKQELNSKVKNRSSSPPPSKSSQPLPAPNKADPYQLNNARTTVEAFLNARNWEDRLPYIYNASELKERIKEYYQFNPDFSFAYDSLNKYLLKIYQYELEPKYGGPFWVYQLQVENIDVKLLIIVRVQDGFLKVDWEAFGEFYDQHFVKFTKGTLKAPAVFRLVVQRVQYEGADSDAFEDLAKFHCYRIHPPYGQHTKYAFVAKNSDLSRRLEKLIWLGNDPLSCIIKLNREAFSHGINHLIITDFITEGWLTGE